MPGLFFPPTIYIGRFKYAILFSEFQVIINTANIGTDKDDRNGPINRNHLPFWRVG